MFKEKDPIISDEFLEDLVKEINEEYGWPTEEQTTERINHDTE